MSALFKRWSKFSLILGLSSNVKFALCKSTSRKLFCPKDYVINIVSAEATATTDGSCDLGFK